MGILTKAESNRGKDGDQWGFAGDEMWQLRGASQSPKSHHFALRLKIQNQADYLMCLFLRRISFHRWVSKYMVDAADASEQKTTNHRRSDQLRVFSEGETGLLRLKAGKPA